VLLVQASNRTVETGISIYLFLAQKKEVALEEGVIGEAVYQMTKRKKNGDSVR
jgi:hypothetical protein